MQVFDFIEYFYGNQRKPEENQRNSSIQSGALDKVFHKVIHRKTSPADICHR
jgi:hypothetical protein